MIRPASVAAIVALYDARGDEHYGEGVTQREHAVQCAALAVAAGTGPAMIAAALLHDIGHLLLPDGDQERDLRHEIVGARALGRLFGRAVTAPVALHVAAKRFLCATDPDYAAGLSDASRRSLALQGGPFDAADAAAFARRPFAADAVALRRLDDCGKSATPATATFGSFVPLLGGLLARQPRVGPHRAGTGR